MPENALGPPGGAYVYALAVADRYLVYAPFGGVLAQVNAAAARALSEGLRDGGRLAVADPRVAELSRRLGDADAQAPARRGAAAPVCLLLTSGAIADGAAPGRVVERAPRPAPDPAAVIQALDCAQAACRRSGSARYEVIVDVDGADERWLDVAVHRARLAAARTGIGAGFVGVTRGGVRPQRWRFLGDHCEALLLCLDRDAAYGATVEGGPIVDGRVERLREVAALRGSSARLCVWSRLSTCAPAAVAALARSVVAALGPCTVALAPPDVDDAGAAAPVMAPDAVVTGALQLWRALRAGSCEPASAAAIREGPPPWSAPGSRGGILLGPDGGVPPRLGSLADWAARCSGCFCWATCDCGGLVSDPGGAGGYRAGCVFQRTLTACALLERLGAGAPVQSWLASPAARSWLAAAPSDRLTELGGPA